MSKVMITDEMYDKIERMYNYDVPPYLTLHNKNKISITASQYEGAGAQNVVITPADVIEYYRSQAGILSSGIRTLAGFSTDWRMVDNMAKEALEIFKIINPEALRKEARKYGMELKE
jgi:hypothetical protein